MIGGETNETTADQNSPEMHQISPESQQQNKLSDDTFRWTRPAVLFLLHLYWRSKSTLKNPN